jgi:hypothetical protein
MPNAANGSPKYDFKHVGNPRVNDDKIKSMTANGPLLVAQDQLMAAMAPGAFDTSAHAPAVTIESSDLFALLGPHLSLSADVAKKGIHFITKPAFWALLFEAMDNTGNEWPALPGGRDEIMPKLAGTLAKIIIDVPIDKRTIDTGDVMYDGDPNDAGTGTWFDKCTPAMLMEGGGSMEVLAQLKALIPNHYNKDADAGRGSDEFKAVVAQIESAVGRDVSQATPQVQAAAVVTFFKRTRPPAGLTPYNTEPMLEIERRAAPTIAARFEPLFLTGWRRAYTTLDKLWPQTVNDIVTETLALATSLGVATQAEGLTPHAMAALVTALNEYKAFATSATNAARTAEVVKAHKRAANGKTGEASPEEQAQMQADTKFQAFKKMIAAVDVNDHAQIAKKMLTAEHPAGLLFLKAATGTGDRRGAGWCAGTADGCAIFRSRRRPDRLSRRR